MKTKLRTENAKNIYQVGNVIRCGRDGKIVMVCREILSDKLLLIDLETGKSISEQVGDPIEEFGDDLYRPGDRLVINPTLVEEGAEE